MADLKHEYDILLGFVESVAAGDMSRESMIAAAGDILAAENDGEEEEDGDPRDFDLMAKDAELDERRDLLAGEEERATSDAYDRQASGWIGKEVA